MIIGIDISKWDGKWNAAKAKAAGAQFVIIKSSQAGFADRRFLENRKKAKDAGILWGVYHYLDWTKSGVEQAKFFLDLIGDDPGDLPLSIDYEERKKVPEKAVACGELWNWISTVKKHFDRVMIYTAPSYWQEFGGEALAWAQFPLWIAHYKVPAPTIPVPWTDYAIWQKTAKGDGLAFGCEAKEVDIDIFNGDLVALQAFAGGATVSTETPSPVDAVPVIPGEKKYQVIAQALNVRADGGVNFPIVGGLLHGQIIRVSEIVNGWAHLKGGGWVSARYIKELP